MRSGWLLLGCTVGGIFFACLVLSGRLNSMQFSYEARRGMLATAVAVGALIGFGLYELMMALIEQPKDDEEDF